MTTMETPGVSDPEWNAVAQVGEIVSQLSQLGEKMKTLVNELEAKGEMAKRQDTRILKRGTLEVKQVSQSFIASFDPESRTVEVNGRAIPTRPGQYRGVGTDPHGAIVALADSLKMTGLNEL